jgi:hypothetical protein
VVVLISALAIGLICLAIVKPWGTSVAPTSPAPGISSPAILSPSSAAVAETPTPTAVAPAPDGFSATRPAPTTAELALVRWRLLAPDDSVSLFRSMLHARGTFVAIGGDPSGAARATPLWTSRDGHTGSRCPSLSLCP